MGVIAIQVTMELHKFYFSKILSPSIYFFEEKSCLIYIKIKNFNRIKRIQEKLHL